MNENIVSGSFKTFSTNCARKSYIFFYNYHEMYLTCYDHRGSKGPRPHENFEAMRILRQCAWTEKVPLHKKTWK